MKLLKSQEGQRARKAQSTSPCASTRWKKFVSLVPDDQRCTVDHRRANPIGLPKQDANKRTDILPSISLKRFGVAVAHLQRTGNWVSSSWVGDGRYLARLHQLTWHH